MPTAAEIKKALKEAGLEVYRTRGDVVYLADRVRENLLMDAGTFVRGGADVRGADVRIGFIVRAQRNDFPNDAEEHLFERARRPPPSPSPAVTGRPRPRCARSSTPVTASARSTPGARSPSRKR